MTSKTEVANTALSIIGELPISSFADDSRSARIVSERYDDVRRAVLRDHFWNSAKARQRLPKLSQSPAFGWNNQFQLPSDWLRLVRINDRDPLVEQYEIEGLKLLTDMTEVKLVYVRDETDPSKWDVMLREAIAARLASEIAVPIVQSREARNDAWQIYLQKLRSARSVDAMDEPAPVFDADLWLRARHGGTGPGADGFHFRDIDV